MRQRSSIFLLLTGAAVALGGCVYRPELVPAPGARPAAEVRATAAGGDIEVRVRGTETWRGFPQNLNERVVPVRVTIENNSQRPLRLRYDDFWLEQPGGEPLAALPPLDIEGRAYVTGEPAYGGAGVAIPRLGFRHHRFWLYEPYAQYWGLPPWSGGFAFDPWYYDTYLPRWPVDLPTPDMLARALPEGVIAPGGRVSGFLYFEQVPRGVDEVTLHARLTAADNRSALGEVRIPFVVE